MKKSKARGSGAGWRDLLSVAASGGGGGGGEAAAEGGRSRRCKQRVSYKEED
jgi:hypothetical protein